MKPAPKTIPLKANEILGMEFYSGYHRYYAFGKDPKEIFKQIIALYNYNAGTKHTIMTFRKLCETDEMSGFLYKFDITKPFGFDDDCQSMGVRNGIEVGRYI